MLLVEINKKTWKVSSEWKDLTLDKTIELATLISSFPEWIKELHTSKEVDLTEEQSLEYSVFAKKVIMLLSDIPIEILYHTKHIDLQALYESQLAKFVSGLITQPDYQYKGIEKFTHNDNEYYLPECDFDISGNIMPCVNITALEFCETTDLKNASSQFEGGNLSFAANVVSILCRKKNEKYDQKTCLERAKEFMNLTMDIVLEVFFCLEQLTIISKQKDQISTLQENLVKKATPL